MRRFLFALFTLLGIMRASAQPYMTEKNRYRFAQSILGIDLQFTQAGKNTYLDPAGQPKEFAILPQLYPRLHIGGTHFWGHTELYLSFPLTKLLKAHENDLSYEYKQSDIFGIKLYPWRIEQAKFRPFVGISLAGTDYTQRSGNPEVQGTYISKILYPVQAGITWDNHGHLFELGASYNYQHEFTYYVSKTQTAVLEIPQLNVWLGYKLFLDGTLASEESGKNGDSDKLLKVLEKKKKLSSISIGIGPSSAFFTQASSFNKDKPYLGRYLASPAFWELGLGYYSYRLNAHVNLSYVNFSTSLSAYGTTQTLSREAIGLEIHKYLLDYNGFVPFLGAVLSWEQLHVREETAGQAESQFGNKLLAPGIIIGWDILPDKLQYMTLRTNVRYYPTLRVETVGNTEVSFQQLEFNFIELILYPGRFKWIRKEARDL